MVCLIETRKEELVETTHPADSVLLTDNARRKFVVELLDARTLNSGVEEEVVFCSLLCSHLRNHDVSPLLKPKRITFRLFTFRLFVVQSTRRYMADSF